MEWEKNRWSKKINDNFTLDQNFVNNSIFILLQGEYFKYLGQNSDNEPLGAKRPNSTLKLTSTLFCPITSLQQITLSTDH